MEFGVSQRRLVSTDTSIHQAALSESQLSHVAEKTKVSTLPPLSVMPTRILIRSLMMTYILSSPRLVDFGIPIMNRISHSKSWFLNPDRNPVLHSIVRKLIYDHFCAGENEKEVKATISTMKEMGFAGVILGYARETMVDKSATPEEAAAAGKSRPFDRVITEWKEGTLRTLGMLGENDYLAVK
jgi:proline dehydrogenase